MASLAVALTLVVAKFVGLLLTGSVSLLATLIDSLVDVFASSVNFFAIRSALVPPDSEHRFGHGKAEPLAGLAQSAFVSGSAIFLAMESGGRLLHPAPLEKSALGAALMVFAFFLSGALVLFLRRSARLTYSTALAADSLHYESDLLVYVTIALALLVNTFISLPWLDPAAALAIVGYMGLGAWKIGKKSVDALMDKEFSPEDREKIKAIAKSHPEVRGVHDLRTRRAGPHTFIQLHVVLDDRLSLLEAHRIADEVEVMLQEAFPQADIIIHQDPRGVVEHQDRPEAFT